jgi:glycolate oxidase iron-sulfur subunit
MQTRFTPAQLQSSDTAASEKIIRTCVHCGFCTATCPTYLLLGDELDSPRGRIQLMKEMLETGGAPAPETVKHVDRCLSCLSCMTTCPSGVNYMHLVDHARAYIEEHHRRPWPERLLRALLSTVLSRPRLFRRALGFAGMARLVAPLAPGRLKGMIAMAPATLQPPGLAERPHVFPAVGPRRARVALLVGCAQAVLGPDINDAAIRLLTRLGVDVVTAQGAGCCGALPHHLGQAQRSHALAKANIEAWTAELRGQGLDAIVITASGCGTSVKDYGYLFRDDAALATPAAQISALAQDVTEFLAGLESVLPVVTPSQKVKVAYQSACSLQHGQKVRDEPRALLRACGFEVVEPAEAHICCGSAGTYNLLQPALAGQLRSRKVSNLEATRPDVIASGNIGCMTQIAGGTAIPVVHTVELLDWATGGPKPKAIRA